jgi:hypothetical protein
VQAIKRIDEIKEKRQSQFIKNRWVWSWSVVVITWGQASTVPKHQKTFAIHTTSFLIYPTYT